MLTGTLFGLALRESIQYEVQPSQIRCVILPEHEPDSITAIINIHILFRDAVYGAVTSPSTDGRHFNDTHSKNLAEEES
jgi:hypothetical protein